MKNTALALSFTFFVSLAGGQSPSPAPSASATATPADAAAPGPSAPAAPGPYKLKNLSSFKLDLESRAPFWPIGWVKPQKGQPELAPGQSAAPPPPPPPVLTLDPKNFNITSILLGPPSLAMINGRSYEEGEFLNVESSASGKRFKILIRQIRDGGVVLDFEKQRILVPVNRPEIPTNRTPEVEKQDIVIRVN